MESTSILKAFLKLLENNFSDFSPQAIQDITNLNASLDKIPTDDIEIAVDIIVDWCAAHQPLGQILAQGDRQIPLKHPIKPPPKDVENDFRQVSNKVNKIIEQANQQHGSAT